MEITEQAKLIAGYILLRRCMYSLQDQDAYNLLREHKTALVDVMDSDSLILAQIINNGCNLHGQATVAIK